MKTRQHHIDLTNQQDVIYVSFHERMNIQFEMIKDHAYLIGQDVENAVASWVENGWAKIFADHYLLKK